MSDCNGCNVHNEWCKPPDERSVNPSFCTPEGWDREPPKATDLPLKGDTVIGKDVWMGQNAVILLDVPIGDGAMVGANSAVGRDVSPNAYGYWKSCKSSS